MKNLILFLKTITPSQWFFFLNWVIDSADKVFGSIMYIIAIIEFIKKNKKKATKLHSHKKK